MPFYRLATLALVVTIAHQAQQVIVPIALAVIIAFALTPAVRAMERRTGRAIATAIVVLMAVGALVGFGFTVERQVAGLSREATDFSAAIRTKIESFRSERTEGGFGSIGSAFQHLTDGLDTRVAERQKARPVRVVSESSSFMDTIEHVVAPVVEPVARTIIVAVLVVFFLLRREDLRDRLIRLAGTHNLSLATKTLDEAGLRISRFLVVQSAINAAFGLAVGVGLYLIGVPYAPLWAFVAGVLRFVPYLGTMLGLVFPTLVAFARLDGWSPTFLTAGMFLMFDLVVGYAVEPLVIGRRTGVSSIALVMMAIFWTWLWGPMGLLLSTPLTVCLAVLGAHVPRLEFLGVLLGDQPALDAELSLYQRLLAADEDEAAAILERAAAQLGSWDQAFDDVFVPALLMAEEDHARGGLADPEHDQIMRTLSGLVEAAEHAGLARPAEPRAGFVQCRVLAVAARSAAEEVAGRLLATLLAQDGVTIESIGPDSLASEVTAAAAADRPDLVLVTSIPPGGIAQVRYLCKRLQARAPGLRVVVYRPGSDQHPDHAAAIRDSGATALASDLAEARRCTQRLLLLSPGGPLPAEENVENDGIMVAQVRPVSS